MLYLLSIEPCKDFLLYPLEKKFPIPDLKNADAIVVLGGGSYNSVTLKEDTANRLMAGYFVFKEINKPIVVSGGSAEGKLSESTVMANFFRKMGVEREKIIEENKSRDTKENAYYVINICKNLKFKNIILITSAYHMTRAVMLFKNKEIKIIPYPADFKTQEKYSIYSFLPNSSNLAGSTKALREYLALLTLYIQK